MNNIKRGLIALFFDLKSVICLYFSFSTGGVMSNKNSESVKLLIEAEYLAQEEFNQATDDVKALAKESEKTDKALDQLEIDKATIKSYGLLGAEINDLKQEIVDATVAQKASRKEFGASSDEYKVSARAVSTLNQDLASLKKSYNSQGTALKKYNVTSKAVEQTVTDLNAQILKSATASREQKEELNKATVALEQATVKQRALTAEKRKLAEVESQLALERKQLASAMKSEFSAQEKLNKATKDAVTQKQKELDIAEKATLASKAEKKALNDSKNALASYEQKLSQLNEERREGYISQGDWIRAEDKLRKSLNLTTAQVTTHKKALEADEKQLKKSSTETQILSKRLDSYKKALIELNAERDKGLINSKQAISREKALRKEYKLTATQAKATRKAVEKKTKSLKSANSSTDALTKTTRRLAQAYTLLLAGSKAIEAIGASVVQFGAVEAGMTKVEKTTGLAREAVADLKDELNEMAISTTPTATKELLNYAEVAGQLGVSSKQGILDLVIASDALQNSTNLAGEEAVTLLTRMLMMSGEGVEGIHNLSSAVTELGNSTAVAEDEIVHMGKEVLTAGASIGLSTDQAVAWGATLKEAGQTAERSRTAIQRLALMIKKASVEGGADLLELTKITGLTSEAIQKGLGEEPEKVLLSFVQGLNRIKESGGVVSTTLEDMGVKSLESQAVLEKLGDVSLRLAENMRTSADASIDANRHLIEASKAYADQESAIGRVVNRLELLKERLGEAFSSDTAGAVEGATALINDYEEAIVQLGEMTASMLSGVTEVLAPLGDAFDGLMGIVEQFAYAVKIAFNGLQEGIDLIILGWQKLAFLTAKALGESSEQLAYLAEAIENTKKRLITNQQDIVDATKLSSGETSLAYIALRDVINKNEEAVESLTERQKLELEGMMRNGAFAEENNSIYRERTALIVRQSRVLDIAEAQANTQAQNEKSRAYDKLESDRKQAESTEKAKQLFSDLFKEEMLLSEYTIQLGEDLDNLVISQDEYNEKSAVAKRLMEINAEQTSKLSEAKQTLNDIRIAELETVTSFVKLAKDETEASTKLITSIQKKEAEIKELEISQVGLNASSKEYIALQEEITALTTDAIVELKELNELRELEDLTLSEVLEVQEKHIAKLRELKELRDADKLTIQEYNAEVEKLATVTDFLNDNLSDVIATQDKKAKADAKAIENADKIAKAKAKEAKASEESAIKNEYEAKTVRELIAIKVDHDKALDALLVKYNDGKITWAEYQLELEKMSTVTDILSSALANNTNAVADNIKQLNEHADAMSRNEKIAEKFAQRTVERSKTQFNAVTASASAFDTTTASVEDLQGEIDTLNSRIGTNSKIMRGSWWYGIAKSQLAMDKASLATTKQAKAVLQLQARYEKMKSPTIEATKAIESSIDRMGDLDSATLDSLRSEVADTISMFDDLKDAIDDSLDSVDDRLDALKGDEQAILDRSHEKEIEEAEATKESASGDNEAVAKANELIKKLKEAQAIEKANLQQEIADAKAEKEAEAVSAKSTATTTESSVASTDSNKQTIVLNLGSKSTEITGDKDDIMALLTDMGYTIS